METKFNFKSQIATDKNQSERLLALGLKKETADMMHCLKETAYIKDWFILPLYHGDKRYTVEKIPAWSLHRLIEMMPKHLPFSIYVGHLCMNHEGVYYTDGERIFEAWGNGWTIYDNMIDCIEWLIKEGHFYKGYLEE